MSDKNKTMRCPICSNEIPADSAQCPNCMFDFEKLLADEAPESEEKKADSEFFDKVFIHESDRKALKTLKMIPGFSKIMKKFIKIFNEKQFKIINLSSNIRIDENQMPEIYNMLPPYARSSALTFPKYILNLMLFRMHTPTEIQTRLL